MSSSDYISLRRMRNMHQLSCNTIPDCHTQPACEVTIHNPYEHHDTNYCVVPAKCVNHNGRVVSTDLVYCNDNNSHGNHHVNQKYITKTVKAYRVVPVKNGTVGFLVDKCLPFIPGQSISCNILNNESNYFNGIVFDYDKDTGFLSIGSIDNVTGNFSNNVVYNVNLIMFDPEVVKLKQRMEYLYKYLFQIDLETTPNFNPLTQQIVFHEEKLYNLYLYLFNDNIRVKMDYEVTEAYLVRITDLLYEYLFDIKLDRNLDFNPNGRPDIPLNNVRVKIYQIYLYLFAVNLEQNSSFNPNILIN